MTLEEGKRNEANLIDPFQLEANGCKMTNLTDIHKEQYIEVTRRGILIPLTMKDGDVQLVYERPTAVDMEDKPYVIATRDERWDRQRS